VNVAIDNKASKMKWKVRALDEWIGKTPFTGKFR